VAFSVARTHGRFLSADGDPAWARYSLLRVAGASAALLVEFLPGAGFRPLGASRNTSSTLLEEAIRELESGDAAARRLSVLESDASCGTSASCASARFLPAR